MFRNFISSGSVGITGETSSTTNLMRSNCSSGNGSDNRSHIELTFFNMSDSSLQTTGHYHQVAVNSSENELIQMIAGGCYTTAEAHNGIRLYMGSGDILGEFTLIGIKG